MNTGTSGSAFSIVTSYLTTSFTMSYTVDSTTDGIVPGKIYSFIWRSYNSKGYSAFSDVTTAAATNVPA